jgi:hypothetical protein
MNWTINSTRDIRTYIQNACGGDAATQDHLYELILNRKDTPYFGDVWNAWFEEHIDRLYEEASRLACEQAAAEVQS